MQYEVKSVQKIGVRGYDDSLNTIIKNMASDSWQVQQILGSPDQGFIILFTKEK